MGTLSFGSFPRSGNHFFQHLMATVLPSVPFIWLDHYIHRLRDRDNVVVSIRTPFECVPSWITMNNDFRSNRADMVLEWYCSYYEACRNLTIVPFTQLVTEPVETLKYICNLYNLEKPLVDSVQFDYSTGFHSPTLDKSGFGQIIDEMMISKHRNHAIELFDELCVPVG